MMKAAGLLGEGRNRHSPNGPRDASGTIASEQKKRVKTMGKTGHLVVKCPVMNSRKSSDLNWRKGLFRLWLVGSIAWVAGFGILWHPTATAYAIVNSRLEKLDSPTALENDMIQKMEKNAREATSLEEKQMILGDLDSFYEGKRIERDTLSKVQTELAENLRFYSVMTAAGPVVPLVLYKVLMWVFLGFAGKQIRLNKKLDN
jgi:hypothetical protein